MTNTASIDYADVVEQLAERQWARMTRSSAPYAALNADDKRRLRVLVEPILADLLDLHGRAARGTHAVRPGTSGVVHGHDPPRPRHPGRCPVVRGQASPVPGVPTEGRTRVTDTQRGPKPCHYDRALRTRVTNEHRDNCPGDHTCPAQGHGCAPCTAPHCTICGREHATNAAPQTCPECQGKIDDDLADIQAGYTALSVEAMYAGGDGRLVAAAPIPGGDAAVLVGPAVRLDVVRVSKTMRTDHRPTDPIPPLAIVARWEDIYRAWLRHDQRPEPTDFARWGQIVITPRRASVAGAIRYLRDQLPNIAQRTDGPDFLAFTRHVRRLRSQLEHALHDEREPERGVECFECGDQLVRRFRDPKLCRHSTRARRWVQTLASYGLQVHGTEWHAARLPCKACTKVGQGGIDDPSAGRSWECPGCRREYDVGEYANAVRRSLVDDGDGWCTLTAAAAAASDITGHAITAGTIRTWHERSLKPEAATHPVPMVCLWRPGQRMGVQLTYWPDVLERAHQIRRRSPSNGRVA